MGSRQTMPWLQKKLNFASEDFRQFPDQPLGRTVLPLVGVVPVAPRKTRVK
jgi:hypothetical protein